MLLSAVVLHHLLLLALVLQFALPADCEAHGHHHHKSSKVLRPGSIGISIVRNGFIQPIQNFASTVSAIVSDNKSVRPVQNFIATAENYLRESPVSTYQSNASPSYNPVRAYYSSAPQEFLPPVQVRPANKNTQENLPPSRPQFLSTGPQVIYPPTQTNLATNENSAYAKILNNVPQNTLPQVQPQIPSSVPQTPCPNYFYYGKQGGKTQGYLRVPPPQVFANIEVKLKLLVHAHLPNNYPGELRLLESEDEIVNRLQRSNFEPIKLSVHFPFQNPLPLLTSLSVNDREICFFNPGEIFGPYTYLDLFFKLRMQATDFSSIGDFNARQQQFVSTSPPLVYSTQPLYWPTNPPIIYTTPPPEINIRARLHTTESTTTTETTSKLEYAPTPEEIKVSTTTERPSPPTPSEESLQEECGLPGKPGQSDESKSRTEWPWLVAIFYEHHYECQGTLISTMHVVTSCSCIAIVGKPSPQSLVVFVGKYNVKLTQEEHSYRQEVGDIVMHDKPGQSVHLDLAILVFKSPVHFNNYIRPVCLFEMPNTAIRPTLVGWGAARADQERGSLIPKKVTISIQSDVNKCSDLQGMKDVDRENVICAKVNSRIPVCKGDLGGGLYRKDTASNRWFLDGVVSDSVWDESDGCSSNDMVLFSNVSTPAANSWILDLVSHVY